MNHKNIIFQNCRFEADALDKTSWEIGREKAWVWAGVAS